MHLSWKKIKLCYDRVDIIFLEWNIILNKIGTDLFLQIGVGAVNNISSPLLSDSVPIGMPNMVYVSVII